MFRFGLEVGLEEVRGRVRVRVRIILLHVFGLGLGLLSGQGWGSDRGGIGPMILMISRPDPWQGRRLGHRPIHGVGAGDVGV